MNNLSTTEIKVLNWVSTIRNRAVFLGTIVDSIVKSLKRIGTPVNAVNAQIDFTISSVVIDGETLSVNNPLKVGTDVYEFMTDNEQTKTDPNNIGLDISEFANKAYVDLTLAVQPTSGDTMTIGSKIYTFVPVGTDTADGEISIGTDLGSAQTAIVNAINGNDGINIAHPLVVCDNFATNVARITAFIGGSSGNTIVSTETFTAPTNAFGSTTLLNGTDCSANDALNTLETVMNASDTQDVSPIDKAGSTLTIGADIAGISGNDIHLVSDITNSSFPGDLLEDDMSGGVNGTVGSEHSFMVDDLYLYICVAENAISGKNWRRISLGDVY